MYILFQILFPSRLLQDIEYNSVLYSRSLLVIYFLFSRVCIWRGEWQPTPVFLPGESHGPRSLVGLQSMGRKESDTTERLTHTHTHTHTHGVYCNGLFL